MQASAHGRRQLINWRYAARVGLVGFAVLSAAGHAAAQTEKESAPTKPTAEERAIRRQAAGNLVGHGGPVKAIASDPVSGAVLSGGFDYAMMMWSTDAELPKLMFRMAEHNGAVNAVRFVPASGQDSSVPSRAIAGADDGTVALWDLSTGDIVHRFAGHHAKVVALAVHGGEVAASASWDRTVRLWDLKSRTAGPVLHEHEAPVNGVAFSHDGRFVFTAAGDGQLRRFRAADGAFERAIYKHGWGINVLEHIPSTNNLLIGTLNGDVAIVDGDSGDVIRALPSHGRPVLAVAVVEKPGLIATGGGDGVVRIMRLSDGAVVEEYKTPFGPVWALAFAQAGTAVYCAGLDDFVTLWRFSPRAAFEQVDASQMPRRFQAKPAAVDALTAAERQLADGELQFARKCSVCHTLTPDGANRAGPTLHRIFGRRIASLPGYSYSVGLAALDIVWTEETVAKLFELGPDVFTPGSKMPLQKMTDKVQRDALIVYLKRASVAAQ